MPQNAIRIVVGDDLTVAGDNALAVAFRFATRMGAVELHVAHVLATGEGLHSASKIDALADEMKAVEQQLRQRVIAAMVRASTEGELDVGFHVRLGAIAEALRQVGVDCDADMIVVGTHGRAGLSKLVLGSVAQELTQSARVPVLIAHPKDYDGLRHSAVPDAPRPAGDGGGGLTTRGRLRFRGGTAQFAGIY